MSSASASVAGKTLPISGPFLPILYTEVGKVSTAFRSWNPIWRGSWKQLAYQCPHHVEHQGLQSPPRCSIRKTRDGTTPTGSLRPRPSVHGEHPEGTGRTLDPRALIVNTEQSMSLFFGFVPAAEPQGDGEVGRSQCDDSRVKEPLFVASYYLLCSFSYTLKNCALLGRGT